MNCHNDLRPVQTFYIFRLSNHMCCSFLLFAFEHLLGIKQTIGFCKNVYIHLLT